MEEKGKVIVRARERDSKITIEIEDKGDGFKPEKVADPTREENLFNLGGRGVFLIQKLMDEVQYKGRGNKVFMVKFLKKNKGGDHAD